MAESSHPHFNCPRCQQKFTWKADRAGRVAVCKCGARFRVPEQPGGEAQLVKPASPAESKPQAAAPPRQKAPQEAEEELETLELASPEDADDAPAAKPSSARSKTTIDAAARIDDENTYELNLPNEEPASSAPPPPTSAAASEASLSEPAAPSEPAEATDIPIATDSSQPAAARCPSCNQAIKPGAVICVKCGFNLQENRRLQTEVNADAPDVGPPAASPTAAPSNLKASPGHDALHGTAAGTYSSVGTQAALEESQRHQRIQLFVPAGLIGFSLLGQIILQYCLSDSIARWFTWVVLHVVLDVAVWTPLAMATLLLISKLLDTSFGNLLTLPYKTLAMVMTGNLVWYSLKYGTCLGGDAWIFGEVLPRLSASACMRPSFKRSLTWTPPN